MAQKNSQKETYRRRDGCVPSATPSSSRWQPHLLQLDGDGHSDSRPTIFAVCTAAMACLSARRWVTAQPSRGCPWRRCGSRPCPWQPSAVTWPGRLRSPRRADGALRQCHLALDADLPRGSVRQGSAAVRPGLRGWRTSAAAAQPARIYVSSNGGSAHFLGRWCTSVAPRPGLHRARRP
jgi:hypothetical protein